MKGEFLGVWIPRDIWFDTKLTWQEKILLMEITYLDGEKGCYATNQYLSERFFGMHTVTVSQYVSRLVEKGYVTIEFFDGKNRVLRSNIKKHIAEPLSMLSQPTKDTESEMLSRSTTGCLVVPLSPIYNNKSNNKNIYIELFKHYTEKIQKRARYLPNVEKLLSKRLETFSKEEIIEAIDRFSKNSWWMRECGHYGPSWFFRDDIQIDKFLGIKERDDSTIIIK
jgi:hypothetical protein